MYCLECGHSWKPEHDRKWQICPECNAKLQKVYNYRTLYNYAAYMAVFTVCEGFQVVRMVWVSKRVKMNCKAEYFGKEVMQHWIDERGGHTTMALSVNGMSQAADAWVWHSEMKVKSSGCYKSNFRHNISPYKSFPKAQILPIFKRNGFEGDFHWISPLEFFVELLRSQYFETLLKSKQSSLLRFVADRGGIYRLWPSIKICIRNNYIIKDAKIWADYIDLLEYFKKDIRNAHFICPKNLQAEHDLLMNKKRKIQQKEKDMSDREKAIQRIEKAKLEKENYIVQKQKFFDLLFAEDKIKIEPLKSVDEFMKEGDELQHCVYTNAYYNLPVSLIMSARINNNPIETIEISLEKMDVVQCRGKLNKNSEHHDQIISLVRKNMSKIQKVASIA